MEPIVNTMVSELLIRWYGTLPETNSEFKPENGCLEYDEFPFGSLGLFSGAMYLLVSGTGSWSILGDSKRHDLKKIPLESSPTSFKFGSRELNSPSQKMKTNRSARYEYLWLFMCKYRKHTVYGRNPAPVEVGSLSHYLQGVLYIQPVVVWDFWTINSI